MAKFEICFCFILPKLSFFPQCVILDRIAPAFLCLDIDVCVPEMSTKFQQQLRYTNRAVIFNFIIISDTRSLHKLAAIFIATNHHLLYYR